MHLIVGSLFVTPGAIFNEDTAGIGRLNGEIGHFKSMLFKTRIHVAKVFQQTKRKEKQHGARYIGKPVSDTEMLDEDHCPICYEDFGADRSGLSKFPCNHIYCSSCFDNYMESQCDADIDDIICPTCRQTVYVMGNIQREDEEQWAQFQNHHIISRLDNQRAPQVVVPPQEAAHSVLFALDNYIRSLPPGTIEDGIEYLPDFSMGWSIFLQSPERVLNWYRNAQVQDEDEYNDAEPRWFWNNMDLYHATEIALIACSILRLQAYIRGDAEKYRQAVERGLQLFGLRNTWQLGQRMLRACREWESLNDPNHPQFQDQ
jgi:hypothetical protein